MHNNRLKILLFVYNFKHKKSVDFIKKLYENNFKIDVIVAAKLKEIKKPKKIINYKANNDYVDHPSDLAKQHNIPYYVVDHNNADLKKITLRYSIDLGIIAGARLLEGNIIKLFKKGIINFHPALLPECRGLDSLLWSIYYNFSLGVTSHLINEKIDSGLLVLKKEIEVTSSDNLVTLHKKIYNLQLDLIVPSLKRIILNQTFSKLDGNKNYNSYMNESTQHKVLQKIDDYVSLFKKNNE